MELHSALLSSNTTASSTALQTFLHYVTLMNDAVMSQCHSLGIQLSSASFILRQVVCMCAFGVHASPLSWGWVTGTQGFRKSEFIAAGPRRSLQNTRARWNGPLWRCERAKQTKERKATSWSLYLQNSFAPSHGHLWAPTHHKTAHINSDTGHPAGSVGCVL